MPMRDEQSGRALREDDSVDMPQFDARVSCLMSLIRLIPRPLANVTSRPVATAAATTVSDCFPAAARLITLNAFLIPRHDATIIVSSSADAAVSRRRIGMPAAESGRPDAAAPRRATRSPTTEVNQHYANGSGRLPFLRVPPVSPRQSRAPFYGVRRRPPYQRALKMPLLEEAKVYMRC